MYVYAIQDSGGNVKFGKSNNPIARRSNLQCGNANYLTLVAVCQDDDYDKAEKHLHGCLRSLNIGMVGEWFQPSLAITLVVNSMLNGHLDWAAQIAMDFCCFFAPSQAKSREHFWNRAEGSGWNERIHAQTAS